MSLLAKATMIITAYSVTGVTVDSMPVADMQQCRKNMVAYVEEMPDAQLWRKTSDAVSALRNNVTYYVKCQPRNKSE